MMPEYHDTPGRRLSEKDQQAQLKHEHDKKEADRKAAAHNRLQNTQRAGPAERMVGGQGLTEAQQKMEAKRAEARAADRQLLQNKFNDQKLGRLPEKSPDRSR